MNQSILMIEDNPHIMKINRSALSKRGYRVLEAETLEQGRELLERENPNLIILDIILPDGSGLDFCEAVRAVNGIPILFLTALNGNQDIVNGLARGGDDYLPKPYDIDVLAARVEALLRRTTISRTDEPPMRLGSLELHFSSRRALLDGRDLLLKPKEFALLEVLARGRDKYFTAEELYEKLWGMDTADDIRTVHNHIYGLRQKLGKGSRVAIEQKRGQGYQLSVTG